MDKLSYSANCAYREGYDDAVNDVLLAVTDEMNGHRKEFARLLDNEPQSGTAQGFFGLLFIAIDRWMANAEIKIRTEQKENR